MWQQSWQSWKVQVSYNKGGEWDWCPNPHFQWFIFRIPGWHCIAGVLLSAEGVISSAEGVLLSGPIEFPGHITLQVSLCVTLSFLVTCHGHSEFPGHLSIITWMDTWISWNCSWMRGCDTIQTRILDAAWLLVPGCLELHSELLAIWLVIVLTCTIFSANFWVWPKFSIICEKETPGFFEDLLLLVP